MTLLRVLGAGIGALIAAELVALPAAIVWGHHGPDWPWIPLVMLAAAGAAVGWRIGGRE